MPSRQGVELVVEHLIVEMLSLGWEVDLVVSYRTAEDLKREKKRLAGCDLQNVRTTFIKENMRVKLMAIVQEIALVKPVFWQDFNVSDVEHAIGGNAYEFTWVSSLGLMGFLDACKSRAEVLGLLVNGLNDSSAATYLDGIRQVFKGGVGLNYSFLLHGLRSPWIRYYEKNILKNYDFVHVQTPGEASNVQSLYGGEGFPGQLIVASNGKNEELITLRPDGDAQGQIVLLMGHLKGPRAKQSMHFIKNIWPQIRQQCPDARLWCVGTAPEDLDQFNQTWGSLGVEALGYVDSLSDVYSQVSLSAISTHQSVGYINRIADSLVAGVPVVANVEPFRTIPGAEDGKCGLCADSRSEFVEHVSRILNDSNLRSNLAKGALDVGRNLPTWKSTIQRIIKSLNLSRL